MQIKFTQNLLEGYQFLFGPDIELEDGYVHHFFILNMDHSYHHYRGQGESGSLMNSSFKLSHQSSNILSARHLQASPKLAIPLWALLLHASLWVVSYLIQVHNEYMMHKVEHAIRIWAEGMYDAGTGKIIAKVNPLSNKPLKDTTFSSTIWAEATNRYITKISTLKDDVWMELMEEAATYTTFTWDGFWVAGSRNSSLAASLDAYSMEHDQALFSDEE